jgi:hypothetical protein
LGRRYLYEFADFAELLVVVAEVRPVQGFEVVLELVLEQGGGEDEGVAVQRLRLERPEQGFEADGSAHEGGELLGGGGDG